MIASKRRAAFGLALAAATTLLSLQAAAQAWPAKPITLIVVFAAGGTADIVGRTLGAKLSQQLGQQVIVDNKSGAGGTLGATLVARAKPDGYTMLMLVSSHSTAETLFKNRTYDLNKDFAPVSLIGTSPYWMLVNPEATKTPTMRDLVALARAQPGKFTFASGGSGGITHLSAEMMKLQGKLDIVHIPFKGNAPALTEVLAGRVDMIFDQPASSETYVKAGKLKPLAVTSPTRMPAYPDVPTMIESGFPGFQAISWFGLAFPAGTPHEIVEAMHRETVKALAAPDLRQKFEAAGITPVSMTPAEFATHIQAEVGRWRTIINDAKVTAD
jgi:tripartite-type tricarboxylate transporter receptor subunit TctC